MLGSLQGDFPDVIDEYLECRTMKNVAFNRRGTLLAAGCTDGTCIIWDFQTRGVAKELNDKDCTSPITSISWSKYGHRILVSSSDKSLTLWDVLKGEKITRIVLQQSVLQARLHPGSSTPTTCLVSPVTSPPMLVNLLDGTTTLLPVESSNKFLDGSAPYSPTAACFNKYGDLIYMGNSNGDILIVDYITVRIRAVVESVCIIRCIVFSRDGKYVVTNSNDRTMRIYENLLPAKDGGNALEVICISNDNNEKAAGAKSLLLLKELRDSVGGVQWKVPCFSGDGHLVIGGSSNKGEHKMYIWDRALGCVVKVLEGPKEGLMDIAWHPVNPIIVSVSFKGLVYVWNKYYNENWRVFSPGFKEIDENHEYVEREDEFDLFPDPVEDEDEDEDEDVDIVTIDKDPMFSDSDGEGELCYLPVSPIPDEPDNHSRSPSLEEVKDRNLNNAPIWLEDNSEVKNWNGRYETRSKKMKNSLDIVTKFWIEKGKKSPH